MKRIYIYIIIATLAMLAKPDGMDVGKLLPVELVYLRTERGQIVIETDTGNRGVGKNVEEAIQHLRNTASGVIFLDTADYLLVGPKSKELVGKLGNYLKSGVRVCEVVPQIELNRATEYLSAHPPRTKLKQARRGDEIQKLTVEKESLILK